MSAACWVSNQRPPEAGGVERDDRLLRFDHRLQPYLMGRPRRPWPTQSEVRGRLPGEVDRSQIGRLIRPDSTICAIIKTPAMRLTDLFD
jgi:hypothetical protein